jgi:hypothetical protein
MLYKYCIFDNCEAISQLPSFFSTRIASVILDRLRVIPMLRIHGLSSFTNLALVLRWTRKKGPLYSLQMDFGMATQLSHSLA